MSRFDYIAYDVKANDHQAAFKILALAFEQAIETLKPGRAKALALTSLEETYMWIGKAIRDEQIVRNGGGASLQEGRKDG